MCGIAGIVSCDSSIDTHSLERVAKLLAHRGPDDCGIFCDSSCGLVHTRLSILDLSRAGHQPMQADDSPIWITYNGEIYNFKTIRDRLSALGWRFHSNTDTEVILKGYFQWGVELFAELRGMYAVAIWNAHDKSLTLARDPFGIKPLYYCCLNDVLVFGSELKALVAFPQVPRRISPTALGQFLRYLYIPEPLSIYSDIQRLASGHILRWKGGNLEVKPIPLARNPNGHLQNSKTICENTVIDVLRDSVAAHLVADVPVGAFLSGGVDSSLVVALMREVTNADIHTFSICYSNEMTAFDESAYARTVANHLGTCHHEIGEQNSVVTHVQTMLDDFDEPFGNPAALIALTLSKYTRQNVKVALSGVGGDEFFGGYPRYLAATWHRHLKNSPLLVQRSLSHILNRLHSVTDRKHTLDRLRRLITAMLVDDPAYFYDNISSFAVPALAASLLAPDLVEHVAWRDPIRIPGASEDCSLAWAMQADTRSYLPGDLLTYTDRASMRYALEVRTPLVDERVAWIASRLNESQKIRGFATKWLLKKIAIRFVPSEVIYRKKKGFSVPMADWLRSDLREFLYAVLNTEQLLQTPELNREGVLALVNQHRRGDNSNAYLLWALLVYVIWRENIYTCRHACK